MNQDRAAQVWEQLFAQYRYAGKTPRAFIAQKNLDLKVIATYGQEQFRAGMETALGAVNKLKESNKDSGEHVILDMVTDVIYALPAEQEKR